MTDRESGTGFEPLRYHQLTKHSPSSVRRGTHRIDRQDPPEQFKRYLELPAIGLPTPAPDTGYPTSRAVIGRLAHPRPLDLAELTRLVVGAAGIKRIRAQAGAAPIYLRTYASAGALYPIEVYLACAGVEGLDDGVYHYSPLDEALRLVRSGDPRPFLLRACGSRPSIGRAPVTAVLSGIPWRTIWKYQARGYRHLFWDAGMAAANLLALCASGGHSSEVVLGFVDSEVDTIVGIDGRAELSLCVIPIGFDEAAGTRVEPSPGPAPEVHHPVGRISFHQREYPEVTEAHLDTALQSCAEAQFWQQDPFPNQAPPPSDFAFAGIERVIRKRGSKGSFSRAPIPADDLESIIVASTYSLACDWGEDLTQVGLVVNAVSGLEPGAYAAVWGMQQIALGDLRERARFLCLEQKLGGDAAATIFLVTDLEDATAKLGARSYRAAQLNAGIVGGRIYLCAYGCGLGATGLTFYDDEVRSLFQTRAEPMLVVAVGT